MSVLKLICLSLIIGASTGDEMEASFEADATAMQNTSQGIYQGDIILTNDQWKDVYSRKATSITTRLWTAEVNGAGVPYRFSSSLPSAAQSIIVQAMQHWQNNTCVRFRRSSGRFPHLVFISGQGCYSYLGRLNQYGQAVSIGVGCYLLNIGAHEIGHALGFHHEQARSDRDRYITILTQNIQSGRESQFSRADTNNYGIPYDYTSGLHYGINFFTSNGKPTMRVKSSQYYNSLVRRQDGFSFYDFKLANTMYQCIDKWMTACRLTTNPCRNEGYIGQNCRCVCRPGTSGTYCTSYTRSYYSALIAQPSRHTYIRQYSRAGAVISPGYRDSSQRAFYTYKLQAPACRVPRLTFTDFHLYPHSTCRIDHLEIRDDVNAPSGNVYCGSSITSGRSFTSNSNYMYLHGEKRNMTSYRGWTGQLSFQPASFCMTAQSTCSSVRMYRISDSDFIFYRPPTCITFCEYQTGKSCYMIFSSSEPRYYRVTLYRISSGQSMLYYGRQPVNNAYRISNVGTINIGPTYGYLNFRTRLVASPTVYARVTALPSDCHKRITLSPGQTATLSKTNYPSGTICEYWIQTTSGRRIQLRLDSFAVGTSTTCPQSTTDSMAIDLTGNPYYSSRSYVRVFCSTSYTSIVTSISSRMNVFVDGQIGGGSFRATVSVV